MPLNALDIPAVSLHDPLLPVAGPVPNAHGGVIAAAHELGVARAEAQGVYRLAGVAVEALYRGDARAPVLDVAAGVARQEVILVVRPRHATEGLVVRGHYQLEGEIYAVPQRELPLLVAGEQSPPARGPAQAPIIGNGTSLADNGMWKE